MLLPNYLGKFFGDKGGGLTELRGTCFTSLGLTSIEDCLELKGLVLRDTPSSDIRDIRGFYVFMELRI